MKREWLVTKVIDVGPPDRAERAILKVILEGRFLANSGVGSPDRAERAIWGVILAWRFLANSGRFCGR